MPEAFKNLINPGTVREIGAQLARAWPAFDRKRFERIHRSNLVGMGVLPLQFKTGDSWESLGIRGDETFDVEIMADLRPQQDATLVIRPNGGGAPRRVPLTLRIDTPIEVDYYRHGGILPFVLRQLLAA